ncbi:MAG: hypothetical protein FJ077_09275 [Cyanobacteria bacterium K_DeepCast_35m_m2_023]|nr:hypothetical protein [Cyanobacteria bacterium K_DeepCast_35m_m2_023]
MTALWDLSGSWTGYLVRGPVQLQILVTVVPVLLISVVCRRLPPGTSWRRRRRLLSLLVVAAATTLLGLSGSPIGLALFLASAYGWWALIDWIRHRLGPWCPPLCCNRSIQGS